MQPEHFNYILAAPIHSGKTTALQHWLRNRHDVSGILTPVINEQRFFHDIKTGEQFAMEAAQGETAVVMIGRFTFSRDGFEKASRLLRNTIATSDWLIIDEVGPLELKEEGFAAVLHEIAAQRRTKTIWVVREHLAATVQQHFNYKAHFITVNEMGNLV